MFTKYTLNKYFDTASFTPLCKNARIAIEKTLKKQEIGLIGNPNATHKQGRMARVCIEKSKRCISTFFETKPGNIFFTSNATEANYTSIYLAIARALKNGVPYNKMHIISTLEEHSSLLSVLDHFKNYGIEITLIKKESNESYSPKNIAKYIKNTTICVSIHYVNSTTGKIQDISGIIKECKKAKDEIKNNLNISPLTFHTDAAQATAYYRCSPERISADLITIDSGKIFGPQGIGAIIINKTHTFNGIKTQLNEIIGGTQAGTPSVALIVGFSKAIIEVRKKQTKNIKKLRILQMFILKKLEDISREIYVKGIDKSIEKIKEKDLKKIAPHILYINIPTIHHPYLLTILDKKGFSVSTSTACKGNIGDGIRIGLLPTHTKKDIKKLIKEIEKNISLALLI